MATAYLSLAPGGQKVVLKTPHLKSDDLNDRLRDEARIGIRLAHPALVETLDLFEHQGKPVLVVAFIDGVSVDGLRRKAALGPAAVCRIGWQIAQGLHAVHCATDENGRALHMVHRDVTAPNVLVDKSGDARLIDLGIARSVENLAATEPGTIKGTVRYLAPELLQGLPPTPKSDLWGLGCVMYEAATGRPIHEGAPAQTMISILREHPLDKADAQGIHPKLREALAIIFERDAAKRIGDGYELAEILQQIEADLGDGESELATAVIAVAGEQDDEEIAAAQAGGGPVQENKIPELTGRLLEPGPPHASGPMPAAPRPQSPFALMPPTTSDPFGAAPAPPSGGFPSPAHSGGFAPAPPTNVHPASVGGNPSGALARPSSPLSISGGASPVMPEIPRPAPRWAVPPSTQTGSFAPPPGAGSNVVDAPSVTSSTPITSPTPIPGVPNPFLHSTDIEVQARPRKHNHMQRVSPTRETLDPNSAIVVYAKKALVLAAVAIALGLAWRFVAKPILKGDRAAVSVPASSSSEEDLLKRTLASAVDLPSCWKGDDGYQFVYADRSGRNVVVDHIQQVPRDRRADARCVRSSG